ncbi:rhodanese-like domain-containing protein [Sediminicola sp. 1XM1-17]|uniref:rhodanese-like domain-containing protein n=1 Tax=Sediminicola sp. 1XM1-17 TaxID=3127702 RepID=UPI00307731F6
MKSTFSLLFLLIVQLGMAQMKSKPITSLSEDQLKSVVLVDVRTPSEFKAGHLKNAKNIDWLGDSFAQQFKDVSKDRPVYVYCKVGGRSYKAAEWLLANGYKDVTNLTGGYDAYGKKK